MYFGERDKKNKHNKNRPGVANAQAGHHRKEGESHKDGKDKRVLDRAEVEQFYLNEMMKEREGRAMRAMFKEMRKNLIEDNEKLRKRRKSREIEPAIEIMKHIKKNFKRKPVSPRHIKDPSRRALAESVSILTVPALLLMMGGFAFYNYNGGTKTEPIVIT